MTLSHSYAHTSRSLCLLPEALKGSDMMLYETCKALGLAVYVRPIAEWSWLWNPDTEENEESPTLMGSSFTSTGIATCSTDTNEEDMKQMASILYSLESWERGGILDQRKVTWLNTRRSDMGGAAACCKSGKFA